jgi:hypothetical protein
LSPHSVKRYDAQVRYRHDSASVNSVASKKGVYGCHGNILRGKSQRGDENKEMMNKE